MIASTAPDHLAMTAMARTALGPIGQANGFTVDFTTDGTQINDANLAQYQVFLQMHLAPFEINLEQRVALEHFVGQGKGWVGIHGAGLIIPSSYVKRNYPDWDFYSKLLGGIVYVIHPALQNGTVLVDDRNHPATRNLPASFQIKDEWYEWDKNPRPNVRVLGRADESTYTQVKPQGDHPILWTYEGFQRAIYIGFGHDASDWGNANFSNLVRDALLWAATGNVTPVPPGADGGAEAGTDVAADGPAATGGAGGNGSGGAGGGGTGGVGTGGQTTVPASGGAGGGSAGVGGGSGGAGAGGTGAVNHGGSSGGCTYAGGSVRDHSATGAWLLSIAALIRRARRNNRARRRV